MNFSVAFARAQLECVYPICEVARGLPNLVARRPVISSAVMSPQSAPMAGIGPQPYRWTCEEYRSLRGAGRFDDRRVMLIDGVILIMPLPDPPHNLSVGLIDDWLRLVFTTGYHV